MVYISILLRISVKCTVIYMNKKRSSDYFFLTTEIA